MKGGRIIQVFWGLESPPARINPVMAGVINPALIWLLCLPSAVAVSRPGPLPSNGLIDSNPTLLSAQFSRLIVMRWIDYMVLWVVFGLANYAIKLAKYKKDWEQEGNRAFFISVLVAAIAFGPVGLLLTLIKSKGKPF